jgi:GGDEF domain-containing protein
MNQHLINKLRSMNESELYSALYKDQLTGAYNRQAFDMADFTTVAIVDMDSLKYLNDTFGHRIGDEFLVELVSVLREAFNDDSVYRLGGDEFAIVSYLSCEALQVKLSHIQKTTEFFTFGVGLHLAQADDQLNKNKERREKSGQRASRGMKPSWIIKISA